MVKRKEKGEDLPPREQKRKKENLPKEQNEKRGLGGKVPPQKHIKNVLSFSLKNTK